MMPLLLACCKIKKNVNFCLVIDVNENFLLYKHIKDFSYEIMKYTNNIPRNLMYIKVNMQECFDNSIRLIRYYIVNLNDTKG